MEVTASDRSKRPIRASFTLAPKTPRLGSNDSRSLPSNYSLPSSFGSTHETDHDTLQATIPPPPAEVINAISALRIFNATTKKWLAAEEAAYKRESADKQLRSSTLKIQHTLEARKRKILRQLQKGNVSSPERETTIAKLSSHFLRLIGLVTKCQRIETLLSRLDSLREYKNIASPVMRPVPVEDSDTWPDARSLANQAADEAAALQQVHEMRQVLEELRHDIAHMMMPDAVSNHFPPAVGLGSGYAGRGSVDMSFGTFYQRRITTERMDTGSVGLPKPAASPGGTQKSAAALANTPSPADKPRLAHIRVQQPMAGAPTLTLPDQTGAVGRGDASDSEDWIISGVFG